MDARKNKKIYIVGAGVSGLVAAKTLETKGYSPVILEANKSIGGKVQTLVVEDRRLDIGFQVLLDAYPMAKKHLNLQKLNLQKFQPGAVIFKSGKLMKIGDPLRDFSLLSSTLFSPVGTFGDKIKILRLTKYLKRKSIEDIFAEKEIKTYDYLTNFGFSSQIISNFFKPFFAGIFLEDKLDTSSRMFEFVFKMFSLGNAVLPTEGIQAIPDQLAAELEDTTIRVDSKVRQIKENVVILDTGQELHSDGTIVATDAALLIENLRNQEVNWTGCDNFYFMCKNKVIKDRLIGLIADDNTLINNIFYLDAFNSEEKQTYLLSVTVVREHDFESDELAKLVEDELKRYCGIEVASFVKHFKIKAALPQLHNLRYDLEPSETQLMNTVFSAGDFLLNGSLNAAMLCGEKAAEGLIEKMEGNFGL